VRSTNLNAAIGLVQLKKLKKFIDIRRANHQYFSRIFKDDKRFFFQKFSKYHSCFAFTLIIKPKYQHLKSKIFKILRKKKIEFRLVTGGSFFKHPVKKYFNFTKFNGSKNVDYVHENGFFVGNHSFDLKKELTFFKNTLDKIK
jgi:CDP-6-deoxy-D-xylo-4-hexulose-3-dehydrase